MATRRESFVTLAQGAATKWLEFVAINQKLQDVYDAEMLHPDAGGTPLTDQECIDAGTDLTAARVTDFMNGVKEFLTVDYDANTKAAVVKMAKV